MLLGGTIALIHSGHLSGSWGRLEVVGVVWSGWGGWGAPSGMAALPWMGRLEVVGGGWSG